MMYQEGERVDNHDRICQQEYAALRQMGMEDDELSLFGVAYVKEGRAKCFISAYREKVVDFVEECREKQIYPTVIENKLKRIRIHSGQREQVEKEFKLEFARSFKEKYPKVFLLELQKLAQCPIHNKAADILNPLRDTLEGCFDAGTLQLYKGAVEFAYDGKILTAADYQENKLWLKRESAFLTERIRKASNFKRIMTGFAYIENDSVKYYTTALEERTQERRLQMISEGKIVSGIYAEAYLFNHYADLPKGIQWFDGVMEHRMDTNYMELIQDLYAIQPEIDKAAFALLEDTYGTDKYMKRTIQYYKTLWHLQD